MNNRDYLIRFAKKGYRLITQKKFPSPDCEQDRQVANNYIYNLLASDKPCMISRYGTTELIAVNNYLCIISEKSYLKKIWEYITDYTHTPWWFTDHFRYMHIYSGIFPPTEEIAERFAMRYLEDTKEIDLLGSFQYFEKFMPLKDATQFVHLETLYPFFVENPWSRVLKNKKILVIHPFEETIKHQYEKRELLFRDKNILPEFELITIRAIQSAAGIDVKYKTWFEALKYMEDQINKIDFDICLLGCGAYGLPLAAHVKRIGKKAVHIGGGLQLLFGIKGKRWDDPSYGNNYNLPALMKEPYCNLYNSFWQKALLGDTPREANKVDGACYW